MLVPTIRTPMTLPEFAHAVLRNWSVTGETTLPSEQALAVLYGQYRIETGGLNTWNWNVGNHKYSGSGNYMHLKGVWELVSPAEAERLVASGQAHLDDDAAHIASAQKMGKVSVVFEPPHPSTRFQAFDSLDAGMSHHLRSVRKHFGKAWDALLSGQPGEFAHALRAQGYYTGNPNDYEAGVRRGYAEFLASGAYRQPGMPLTRPAPVPWLLLGTTALLVAGTYALTRKGHRLPALSRLRFP